MWKCRVGGIGVTGVAEQAEHVPGANAVADLDLECMGLHVGVEGEACRCREPCHGA